MSLWLLEPATLAELRDARGRIGASELADLTARAGEITAASGPASRREGRTAHISVTGVLTPRPDLLALLFTGANTTYGAITDALQAAESDSNVESIVLDIDSPGGAVAGLFDVLDAIHATRTPTTARVRQATSAAYAIASQADTIEAVNRASTVGSIGVAASFMTSDRIVDIASTDAPNKRPDVRTTEGQATVRRHLDDVHALFVGAIARGRGTTAETANQSYGRGGVLLADDARRAGMIDSIAPKVRQLGAGSLTQQALQDVAILEAQMLLTEITPRLAGETDEQFIARIIAMDVDPDAVQAQARQHREDVHGHRVAASVERLLGVSPVQPTAQPTQGERSFEEQVMATVERRLGVTPMQPAQPAQAAQEPAHSEDFASEVARKVEERMGLSA